MTRITVMESLTMVNKPDILTVGLSDAGAIKYKVSVVEV
jgi:hypothetical protein